jgi:hypothetical protein
MPWNKVGYFCRLHERLEKIRPSPQGIADGEALSSLDCTAAAECDSMKRLAVWLFYATGLLAIGYLALYAYVVFSGRDLRPGDPIHIFQKPDAPNYSSALQSRSSS